MKTMVMTPTKQRMIAWLLACVFYLFARITLSYSIGVWKPANHGMVLTLSPWAYAVHTTIPLMVLGVVFIFASGGALVTNPLAHRPRRDDGEPQ